MSAPATRDDEPAERADAADPLETSAQLRLKDDDEREEADDRARLQDLRQQLETQGLCQDIDDVEDRDADHEAHRAGAADQAEQPVDQQRGQRDIEDCDRLDREAPDQINELV
jgi:hypothetical protein